MSVSRTTIFSHDFCAVQQNIEGSDNLYGFNKNFTAGPLLLLPLILLSVKALFRNFLSFFFLLSFFVVHNE